MSTKRKTKARKMPDIKRILVPIDFSKNSHQALDHAVVMAGKFGARIALLHIANPVVYPTELGIVVADQKTTVTRLQKELVKLRQKLIPAKLRGPVIVGEGQPHDEIAALAEKLKTDLIVLTTHGYTGLSRVLLGGTAERVVRHAPCPVLIIRIA